MKVIAATLGDPAGIGPEILVKALRGKGSAQAEIAKNARVVIFGSADVLNETCERLGMKCEPTPVTMPFSEADLDELNIVGLAGDLDFAMGEASKLSGTHALNAIYAAADAACAGYVDAMVTMPASKIAFALAGVAGIGHTEILRERVGVPETTMFLENGPLRFALATTHLPIRKVADSITEDKVLRTIRAADKAMKKLYEIAYPVIGVMALNPHAGEGGMFGEEERDVIIPALKRAQNEQINVRGPFPADVAVAMQKRGSFDALVAMYHDQALVPLKLIEGDGGFNITLGLPFIRTSPLHGTAYDIAGRNFANPSSAIAAIRAAIRFSRGYAGRPVGECGQ